MVPLVKCTSTEMSVAGREPGVQVHGAWASRETGAEQYLRESRILPIYEGTTANSGQT